MAGMPLCKQVFQRFGHAVALLLCGDDGAGHVGSRVFVHQHEAGLRVQPVPKGGGVRIQLLLPAVMGSVYIGQHQIGGQLCP